MTVKHIQQSLISKFSNHKYELCNSYVFSWECDFFSISDSGYTYEVEIKLSRGDFFADFKKEKHKVFNLVCKGKTYYWENAGFCTWSGTSLGTVHYKQLVWQPRGYKEEPGVTYDWQTGMYTGNQFQHYKLQTKTMFLHAPCTRIRFIDLTKKHIPHRFFYACPEGLIKPNEVPAYAGLIYVNADGSNQTVKQAPFIHKRPLDLSGILLDKFYYECRDLRYKVWKMEHIK